MFYERSCLHFLWFYFTLNRFLNFHLYEFFHLDFPQCVQQLLCYNYNFWFCYILPFTSCNLSCLVFKIRVTRFCFSFSGFLLLFTIFQKVGNSHAFDWDSDENVVSFKKNECGKERGSGSNGVLVARHYTLCWYTNLFFFLKSCSNCS